MDKLKIEKWKVEELIDKIEQNGRITDILILTNLGGSFRLKFNYEDE